MNKIIPRSFHGSNSKEALQKTREALGEDAAIVQNRTLSDGSVEILAIASEDLKSASGQAVQAQAPVPVQVEPSANRAKSAYISNQSDEFPPKTSIKSSPIERLVDAPNSITGTNPEIKKSSYQSASHKEATTSYSEIDKEKVTLNEVQAEVKAMRGILENQMATMAWSNMRQTDHGKMTVVKSMLNAGFSPLLARTLCQYTKPGTDAETVLKSVKLGLARNIKITNIEPLEEGGVFALVGPTGVGKTTTTAKLAARAGSIRGPRSFALLTTDSYRLAAEEQLAAFGRILGVPVHRVSDHGEMKAWLNELSSKQVILIDTVGTSQKDRRVAEQVLMLSQVQTVRRILVLNASASGTTLEEIANTYLRLGPLSGVILTKIDEATHIGTALDVLIRKKLPLLYVTTGQRVPDDIETPEPQFLVDRAFAQGAATSPFTVTNFEVFVESSSR